MAGYEAGQKLIAVGAADSSDPALQQLLAQLRNKGWLDKRKAKVDKQFPWLLGRWKVDWTWCMNGPGCVGMYVNPRDQEEFVVSDSGIEGYLIGGDGVKNRDPDFRGEILDAGEIRWECYLPPSDTGGFYVFRHVKGSWATHVTVGRRSDPNGYFPVDSIDTGSQQFYPSGWLPIISYKFDQEKHTMTIVIPSQDPDPQFRWAKKGQVTLTFSRTDSGQDEHVESQQISHFGTSIRNDRAH